MTENFIVKAQLANFGSGIELLVGAKRDGKFYAASSLPMDEMSEAHVVQPTLTISKSMAQSLIDDLYNAGFRPTNARSEKGALKATEHHLEDMRKLAAHGIGVEL